MRLLFSIILILVSTSFPSIVMWTASFSEQTFFNKPHTEYLINDVIDLSGEAISIPEDCVIKFGKEGKLKNGCVIGNSTTIIAGEESSNIFQDVIIQGSWRVNKIFSSWFDFNYNGNNTNQLRSMFALCSSEVKNIVYISAGTYWIDSFNEKSDNPAIILIPSKTTVYNKATFKALPNNKEQSFLFCFWGASECVWDGGVIIGDLESHQCEDGQQGFGIALRGAKDIIIKNVECRDCWGDGINLQYGGTIGHNENILIENVLCDRNRRQGISVEDGINVVIRKSQMSNTGTLHGHLPMKGIDIEPYYPKAIIKNVTVENCILEGNTGGGINCSFIKSTDSSINIRNIDDRTGGLRFNSCLISSDKPGITVIGYKCEDGKLSFKRNVNNVKISDSYFMSALKESSHKDTLSNISIHNVSFVTEEPRTWNYYCLSLVCAKMENIFFDKCHFEIKEGSTLSSVLPSGGDWTGVQIRNSTLIENRNAWFYIPCDIINSRIIVKSGLSFICSKKETVLQFRNNNITINDKLQTSPFLFHGSSNQKYLISGNTFYYSGNFDKKRLIVNHKANNAIPDVVLYRNKWNQR